jgi:hypothetical protein
MSSSAVAHPLLDRDEHIVSAQTSVSPPGRNRTNDCFKTPNHAVAMISSDLSGLLAASYFFR